MFSIFPGLVEDFCSVGLLGKGRRAGVFELRCHDPRRHTTDAHRSVDDAPFGGGPGMVLRPEPIFDAVQQHDPPRPLLLLGPAGTRFDQNMANELAVLDGFSLLCGRYEGIDDRVRQHLVDGEVSVGDVVLSGGEVGACLIIETVTRLLEGAMGNASSPLEESFGAEGLLEQPVFTRPASYRGWAVPDELLSGDHARVGRWRHAQALHRTIAARPDLIVARGGLSDDELALLEEFPSLPYP
ncbi:tRNA (guanosine(37)-N1)-methyltransferase TrmD [soil metagenome]